MNNDTMKYLIGFGVAVLVIGIGALAYNWYQEGVTESPLDDLFVSDNGAAGQEIDSFEACTAAGNPIMESYPRQCRTKDGRLFVEYIIEEQEEHSLIRVEYPEPGEEITSPLTVRGEARGTWYFEASFPITVVDWDGRVIGQGYAQAEGEWMTEEFVPFEGAVEFTHPFTKDAQDFMRRGTVIFQKDNPSGLPEHDDAFEVPVRFKREGAAETK